MPVAWRFMVLVFGLQAAAKQGELGLGLKPAGQGSGPLPIIS